MINDNRLPGSDAARPPADLPRTGRRRVRMTREIGQSLVVSSFGVCGTAHQPVEIRICEVCVSGVATIDVLLPESMFVERKETLDGVHALFRLSRSPLGDFTE